MKVTEGILLQSLTWWLPPQYKNQNISLVVTLNTFDLKLLYSNTNESKHDRKQQEPMLNILKYKKNSYIPKLCFYSSQNMKPRYPDRAVWQQRVCCLSFRFRMYFICWVDVCSSGRKWWLMLIFFGWMMMKHLSCFPEKGTFIVTDLICKASERTQSFWFKGQVRPIIRLQSWSPRPPAGHQDIMLAVIVSANHRYVQGVTTFTSR